MPRFDGRFFPSSKVADWASGKFGTPGWYPAAPTGVTPTEGDQQVALSWDAGNTHGSDITGYKVEKNDGSWSTVTSNTGSATASYTATGLTNGTAYTFRVTAINGVGEGEAPSATSASKTPRGVPAAPGTLSLAAGSPAHTAINLSWSAGSANGSAITGYKIQKSTDGSSWSNLVADTGSTGTTYSNTGLTEETTYHYRVAAINVAGTGGYGNEPSRETDVAIVEYTANGSPTVRTHGIYTSVHWTGTGSFAVTGQPAGKTFDVWVVAGGGAGGHWQAGGGGAGGAKAFTGFTLTTDSTYTVTIPAGGTGTSNNYTAAGSGGDAHFGVWPQNVAHNTTGGGGGGSYQGVGANGGSGGGGGCGGVYAGGSGTSGQGGSGGSVAQTTYSGRYAGGAGGGGYPSNGGSPTSGGDGGNGGAGANNNYADGTNNGVGVGQWAGGGQGGSRHTQFGTSPGYGNVDNDTTNNTGGHATANTGAGGSGGNGAQNIGPSGASGAVVIRWET